MLLRTRSCQYENFVFVIGQCHFKDTQIKSVLTEKKNKQTTKTLQPRIEPGLRNLTLLITSTLPRLHNSNQEKFDYPIIISYPLVIHSTTFELLFQRSLKKGKLNLRFAISSPWWNYQDHFWKLSITTNTAAGVMIKEVRKSCWPNLFKALSDSFSCRNEI